METNLQFVGEIPRIIPVERFETGFSHPVWGRQIWLYGPLALDKQRKAETIPGDLFLEFANLSHHRWNSAEDARLFLSKWGALGSEYVIGRKVLTADEMENKRIENIPTGAPLPEILGKKAFKAHKDGFFAIQVHDFYTESEKLFLFSLFAKALEDSRPEGVRQAAAYFSRFVDRQSGWGLNRAYREGSGPEEFFERVPLKSSRSFLLDFLDKKLTTGVKPSLQFRSKRADGFDYPFLGLQYDYLLPLMEGQLLFSILKNTPLGTCRRCKGLFLPKRNTKKFCGYGCAHAVAQGRYEKSKKGRETKRRFNENPAALERRR